MHTIHSKLLSGRALARSLRLSTLLVLSIMCSLLLPLFTSAAHAQSLAQGTVVAWGDNSEGQTNVPVGLSGVTAIAAGSVHSLALKNDGTVVAWGNNQDGQISVPAGLNDVIAIAAGGYHSLALKSDGTVVAWGNNGYGQTSVPAGLSGVTAIAAGWSHSLALKSDGTLVAWGDNTVGQLNLPGNLANVKVTAIAAKWGSNLALASDGTVFYWGWGVQQVPAEVNAAKNVTAIADGQLHGLALKSDGTVVAWGDNSQGQTNVPAGLTDVVAIAADYNANLALKRNGTVVAWGRADDPLINMPAGLTGVTAIAAGQDHGLALIGSATPPAINHSASVQVLAAPNSVVEGTLESNQSIRVFTERQDYTLPQALTVNGTIIPAGTKVNVFYIHADKVGNDNSTALKLSGWAAFDSKVLAVVSDGATLLNTHATLGSSTTTYSTSTDQGIEYGDSVTQTGQNQVNISFSLWNGSDNVRVITLAQ